MHADEFCAGDSFLGTQISGRKKIIAPHSTACSSNKVLILCEQKFVAFFKIFSNICALHYLALTRNVKFVGTNIQSTLCRQGFFVGQVLRLFFSTPLHCILSLLTLFFSPIIVFPFYLLIATVSLIIYPFSHLLPSPVLSLFSFNPSSSISLPYPPSTLA